MAGGGGGLVVGERVVGVVGVVALQQPGEPGVLVARGPAGRVVAVAGVRVVAVAGVRVVAVAGVRALSGRPVAVAVSLVGVEGQVRGQPQGVQSHGAGHDQ